MECINKKALVCGMALSGVSAGKLLVKEGYDVTIQDYKKAEELETIISILKNTGINILTGKNPDDIILDMDLVVLSPGVPADLPFLVEASEKGVEIVSEVELGYRYCKCPIYGITGTNGKTTTTTLLGEILKRHNSDTFVVGNIGNAFTSQVELIKEDSQCACELSSFQLEKINTFKPHIASVLNISQDHLDRHKTMENYINMKERIFLNQTEEDYLILNYDDKICRDMKEKAKSKVFYFSSHNILEEGIYLNNGSIYIKAMGLDQEVININELKILGTHNYENVSAAIMMAVCGNIPIETIISVVKEFKAVEHRIEFVRDINGVDFYNDSKGTNPDSAIKAIESMIKPTILIGGGYDKKANYNDWVKSFSEKVKLLILIGETAKDIEKVCLAQGFNNILHASSLEEAVNLAYENAKENETVLLSPACASWGMFENYEERGRMFKGYVLKIKTNYQKSIRK